MEILFPFLTAALLIVVFSIIGGLIIVAWRYVRIKIIQFKTSLVKREIKKKVGRP